MATFTAQDPKLIEVIGSFLPIACGVVNASGGTSQTVTVPQLKVVQGAVVTGLNGTTAMYIDTVSGNTFTVTTGNNEDFCWIAWGIPNA